MRWVCVFCCPIPTYVSMLGARSRVRSVSITWDVHASVLSGTTQQNTDTQQQDVVVVSCTVLLYSYPYMLYMESVLQQQH